MNATEPLTCPNCGSTDLRPFGMDRRSEDEGWMACDGCEHTFPEHDEDRP